MVAISTGDMTRDLKQNLLIQSLKKYLLSHELELSV